MAKLPGEPRVDGAPLASHPTSCSSAANPLPAEQARSIAAVFKALSSPTRVRALWLLEAGERCVHDLVTGLDVAQPTMSHHLRVLAEAGLVQGERRGNRVWYAVVPETMAAVRGLLGCDFR